jgi:hypothetical protein
MPISLDSETLEQLDKVEQTEGGKGLRRILEEALADKRAKEAELATLKTEKVLANGYSEVKPEDLAGVPVDQLEDRAKELHEQRLGQKREVARQLLAGQGLEGDALDQAVEKMLGGQPVQAAEPGNQFGALRQVTEAGGSPTPVVDPNQLHGVAAIEAALSNTPG